ncbi:MAG TPA: hypothetical protein EYP89_04710, partial [Candidatus Omnitrophica bacterium]|nr:hypothetical protein [Candidatus Omnitrophota bacterium]
REGDIKYSYADISKSKNIIGYLPTIDLSTLPTTGLILIVKFYEKIVFHCFSYSTSVLKKITEKKGYVSFSLNILRKKEEIITSLKNCPLECLLLETDSPYMKIGNRDSFPYDIKEVYSFVADLKSIEKKELEEKIFYNTKRLFNI